jgi:hypothetical protein
MQKIYLFPVQIGMPHANASKSVGYMVTIGNAVNVHSPDIDKLDIYRRKD